MKLLGTFEIDIYRVDPGQRLRPAAGHWVEALAADIKDRGQITAISVIKSGGDGYRLAAGMTRLAAMSTLADTIRADVWDPEDKNIEEVIKLLEIDENLLRQELNALDRGVFLVARKTAYEAIYPETKNGANGGIGGKRNENGIFSFSLATSELIGLGPRSIEMACRIGTLPKDILNRLSGTKYAKNGAELYNLTKLEPEQLDKVVDQLLDETSPASSVAAALKVIEGRTDLASPQERNYRKLLDAWNRAGPQEQARFLGHIRREATTDGAEVADV